jgi:uncharacterized membrane protein HdeD (DUF308 family)
MSTPTGPRKRTSQGASRAETRLPVMARYWWLTALRGLFALMLALAIAVAGRSISNLITFLAVYWLTGGLLTLRFALAIRPAPGFGLGLAAATSAVVGAVLVLARDRLSGIVHPDVFIVLLGIPAVLTGLLRILGGYAFQERLGRRWTLDGTILGTLELALGALLLGPRGVGLDLLVPITAAWGAVSGILLLTQGLQLRRVART